ncbi:MAG: cation transporter, partial [Planctomycetota bacterium]
MAANALLAVGKLIAGIVGHSYALIADAVESMADIVGSLIVWFGMRIAIRDADENHPYGHGKAEPLAAMTVGVMLLGAAGGIAIAAIREIVTPHHAPAPFTLIVLLAVVVIKEVLYRIARRAGEDAESSALLVEALHHRSDALTSTAAALGIGVALWGGAGWEPADDFAALFAAGVIAVNAVRIMRRPLDELMDAAPPEMVERVRVVAREVAGVVDVEKTLVRKGGMRYWVDIHVEVDPDMSVRRAHGIAHDVKDHLCASLANVQDVLVHVE